MPRSRFFSYALLAFLLGCGTGAIAGRWILWATYQESPLPFRKVGALSQIQKDLALTPVQVRQLEAILDKTALEFSQIHADAHHVRAETREKIRAILNEEQRKKYDAGMNRLEKRYGWH